MVLLSRLILIFVGVISCNFNSNERNTIYRFKRLKQDKVFKFTEIGFSLNDTLSLDNKETGEFIFINKLQDSIEVDTNDSRFISVLIWISSKENKISTKQTDTFSLEVRKINDTIKHSFSIIPNCLGQGKINIDISENIFLHSKKYLKKGRNRLLNNSYTIEYPINVTPRIL